MQRAVVAVREENIHEANLRRERQNFVGPRHRIVHGNNAHVGEFIQTSSAFWMESLKDSRKVKYG